MTIFPTFSLNSKLSIIFCDFCEHLKEFHFRLVVSRLDCVCEAWNRKLYHMRSEEMKLFDVKDSQELFPSRLS